MQKQEKKQNEAVNTFFTLNETEEAIQAIDQMFYTMVSKTENVEEIKKADYIRIDLKQLITGLSPDI